MNRHCSPGRLLLALTLAILAGADAHATELKAIAPSDPCAPNAGKVDVACEAPAGNTRRSALLVATQGAVTFDLPDGLTVGGAKLPAGATLRVDDLMLYDGKLIPEVWRLNAGDVVDIKLRNQLTPGDFAATNLHTHGLLVSPDLDTKPNPANPAEAIAAEPVGDTVYVCTLPSGQPAGSEGEKRCTNHGGAAAATHARLFFGEKRDEMNYQIALPDAHPEGLFWYHPHVHGNARTQVGAGLSGLIFIKGKPAANGAGASGGARPQDPAKPVASIEKFMMLKDIQIDQVTQASPGTLNARFLPVDSPSHKSDLCGPGPGDAPPLGACFTQIDDPDHAGQKLTQGWLFTVNGQVFPQISLGSGEQQIWRIANASADMTYDLALVETTTGRPLRVQILARDGVAVVAQSGGASTPVMADRVLLMPGSRIEIGVDRATAEGRFDGSQPLEARLRSYGFFTGETAGFGDSWPAVDLAAVSFAAEPTTPPAALESLSTTQARLNRPKTVLGAVRQFQPFIVSPWQPGSEMARAVAPDRNEPMPAARPSEHAHGGGTDEHPQPPAKDACAEQAGHEDRIIALAIHVDTAKNIEDFKIGADCATFKGADWAAHIKAAEASAASFGKNSVVLAARAGRPETWTIVNDPLDSNHETHNFHVHQMKFEVIDLFDPTGRITMPRGKLKERRFDSYPVPTGGYLRIRIDFNEQMVGGRFVFHCHILEHEDKGMMAEIEVK
ncbi:multicopper oxidase family protein [Bradyrhizobium sp. ORS 285]|uniref:multicopper oxidase family protein n=1 Tax=Bradyrhizobium sp. ORS 285 TaxID=115808 RepID=UPI0002D8017C|nr:multicopper oxidase domain-containing protein [Bradyrhizobium sp. ORS 285]